MSIYWPDLVTSNAYRQAIQRALDVYGYSHQEVSELFDVSLDYVYKYCEGYMRNRATAKKCGTTFESAVAEYLTVRLEKPIERRARTGAKDKGDIAGVTTYDGRNVVVECKCEVTPTVSSYLKEAETEKANANADASFVVFKRVGIGMKSYKTMGRQHVVLGKDDLFSMANITRIGKDRMFGADGITIGYMEKAYHGSYHIEECMKAIEYNGPKYNAYVILHESKNGDWFAITTLEGMANILSEKFYKISH